jgi:putative transposase
MVRRCGLHLVSKLRRDAALYLPFTGEQKKKGTRRKYGKKLDYSNLPETYRVSQTVENGIKVSIYNMACWHKYFPDQLNIVVIVKVNMQTKKRAHVILFSSDLNLSWENVITYYKLRFQIEFNFRDAKQYWGLEDFMNVNQLPVYNAANLAMFMGNLSQVLRCKLPVNEGSVPDLKARFRGHWYGQQVLKLLPISLDPLLMEKFFAEIYALVRIHPSQT